MKKLTTNLVVKIDKQAWYDLKIIAESNGKTKDKAFEEAVFDYVRKHKKPDIDKIMEGT